MRGHTPASIGRPFAWAPVAAFRQAGSGRSASPRSPRTGTWKRHAPVLTPAGGEVIAMAERASGAK
jgi:hypothetical protein